MASKNPNAPVCEKCGRSNGIHVDITATVVWRNGGWRFDSNPDPSVGGGDMICPCEDETGE